MNSLELKIARMRANKSQDDLADAIGKSRISYSKKECGKVKFSDEERFALKDALDLTWEECNNIFFDNDLPIGKNGANELPTVL